MSVTVLYFASLRDAAGVDSEVLDRPDSLAALYQSLRIRHGFSLAPERLRVSIDGAFSGWDATVNDGAEIAFMPPVSGG
jgi:molybdopterin synthase sulfur carrier subunit